MVEHHLAKVNVVGSSPIFRSRCERSVNAHVVKLADTQVLGTCAVRLGGSSPSMGMLGQQTYGAYSLVVKHSVVVRTRRVQFSLGTLYARLAQLV